MKEYKICLKLSFYLIPTIIGRFQTCINSSVPIMENWLRDRSSFICGVVGLVTGRFPGIIVL